MRLYLQGLTLPMFKPCVKKAMYAYTNNTLISQGIVNTYKALILRARLRTTRKRAYFYFRLSYFAQAMQDVLFCLFGFVFQKVLGERL